MQSLRNISCASREYRMYVVIALSEMVDCEMTDTRDAGACGGGAGYITYNTNVVFDRDGKVIARYRKYNLFGEAGVSVPPEVILSTFRTDFNVTFGQFICFDLMFDKPSLQLINDLGVTDIVYSTYWYSEAPFLFSVMAQCGWANANNVNLLASCHNDPRTASGGSYFLPFFNAKIYPNLMQV